MSYENDEIYYEVGYVYQNNIGKVCAIFYRTHTGEYKDGRGCIVRQTDDGQAVKIVTETANCVTIRRSRCEEYKADENGYTIKSERVRVS